MVGARVDGPVSEARFISHVVTDEDGVRAVDTLTRRKDGSSRADFIKIYSHIPRAAYLFGDAPTEAEYLASCCLAITNVRSRG